MSPEIPVIIFIFAVPVYFFSRRFLRSLKIGNESNRKILALVPTLVISPLIYVMVILTWIAYISYYPSNDFDKSEWESRIEQRYTMSQNIIVSEMLIGKTRTEVIGILGDSYSLNNEFVLTYELGCVPGLINIDSDFLEIKFKIGVVASVEQRGS